MITTNVPSNINRPSTFHQFNYLRASNAIVSVPLTIAIIGTMSSAGTATPGVIYEASDATTTDALFGVGSELAIDCRKAYECSQLFGRGPRVRAVAVVEPSGGTANVKTATVTGTATTDGNVVISVAGRVFNVGVRSGDVQNTVATAISNELKKRQDNLPVVPTVATNVVTLTHPHKGVNGKDIAVTVLQQVAGVSVAIANTVVGAGVADHQPALDALSPQRYEGIVLSNHAAADIAEILLDLAVRWSVSSKTWGYYFIGEMGTLGTATALAAAANHQSTIIANMEGCLSTAGEIATAVAMRVFSSERPNAGYNGAKIPLSPPTQGTWYTGPEVETGIAAGLTVLNGIIDSSGAVTQNAVKIERLVTSKTTTSGVPDDRNRDIAVSRTGVSLAIQLDIATALALGPDTNQDGVPQDETTDQLILDLGASILRAEADAGVISKRHVESDVQAMQLEHDAVTIGRNNVQLPYHAVVPLGQIAWVHNIQIGG